MATKLVSWAAKPAVGLTLRDHFLSMPDRSPSPYLSLDPWKVDRP
ncbi:hypothetical protein [Microcoleus sp. Pol10D4]